ncbi:hypothetical protein GCM10012275_50950 [Longimycelium tulufanense]|uniref:Hydrolase of the HAD superfamily n=1 Tax=Longimycelium tulufanense TaxID=907463 RepID=A0A8J3CIX8_9PSEU|nr:HAD family phosphatase [Longimycelium tulufanense]GGM74046.1 hypothetical protein GCM10012275_50950 [Longimycelium tulufanense]
MAADVLVVDFGGVLTTPVPPAVADWLTSDNIDPNIYREVMREWLLDDPTGDSPAHRLETGELAPPDFERQLAARLRHVDGTPVPAAGLLSRMFAALRTDEDMVQLLRQVQSAGVRTALLSNSWGNSYPTQLLAELFDLVAISSEIGLRKPDPQSYQYVLDQLGVRAARCVFVDDLPPNVTAATALGMAGVLHETTARTRTELARLLPIPREVSR